MAPLLYTSDMINKANISNIDHILGTELMMPFPATNSGSRKLMHASQIQQGMLVLNADVPYIQTGYEKQFGENSSSYITANKDLLVIGKVAKYDWMPRHHYFLFGVNEEEKRIYVFERKEYKHITESYGYLYNNDVIDAFEIGSHINAGQAVQKSIGFDEFDNRQSGKNLLTLYTACEDTMEDAIVISQSAADKMSSPLIKKIRVMINDNDIPLNLYGDNNSYKVIPDIGEEVKSSILCGIRKEKKEECLYSQSYQRLRELNISDTSYFASGKVVDVNVYCNAPENLINYDYNGQIKGYYNNMVRYSKEIVACLDPYLKEGYTMEYDLQMLYSESKGLLNGVKFYDERAYSNMILEIYVLEELKTFRGDKLCNRYGGKGVISKILPDELMPRTKDGKVVEIILNMCGVYGRENAGQLFEVSISYICMKIMQFIKMNVMDAADAVDMYLTLLRIVAPKMLQPTEELFDNMSDEEIITYISGMIDDDPESKDQSLYLVIEPMSENITIDKLNELYKEFPWIKPEPMLMPVIGSNGKVRYAPSRRPLIYGYQYIYRLKQYAEEKFSVTSLSATNIRNENSKSKSSNNYKALYSRTPIRFGDMETGNLIHLGAEIVIEILMIYSSSPTARRLTSEMLTGDAFDPDIRLDTGSKNRNVEILNTYLKTMGLRLVFQRTPKVYQHPILTQPLSFFDPLPGTKERLLEPLAPVHPDEKIDIDVEVERLMEQKDYIYPLLIEPLTFLDEPKTNYWFK